MRIQKILIVDDSKVIQKMYEILLGQYTLMIVDNGLEALKRIASDSDIDLVILDLNMPALNGYDTLKKIKTHESYKELPVIVISVDASDGKKQDLLEAGAIACLNKPLNSQKLLPVIQALESSETPA